MAGRGPGARLLHLLRLWWLYACMDLVWMLRDLRYFLTCYLSDALSCVGTISAVFLLAERFAGLGHWGKPQVLFMLGYATAVEGVMSTFFGFNILHISRRLGRGQLDHILVQPQPIWMALATEGFAPFSGSAMLLPGLGLLAWAGRQLSLAVSPGWLALLGLNLAASAAVFLSFSFLWGSLAFWAPRAAEEISASAVQLLAQLKGFPLEGVAPALIGGLTVGVPAGLVAWYPCRFLAGVEPAPTAGLITPLAATGLVAAAAWVFGRGLRHYGRTGGQRYTSFGHRR